MAALPTLDLSKYVESRFWGNRPHLRDRRIPIATLAHSANSQGWDVEELAYQFTLTEAEVLAALLYYAEHEDDVEAEEAVYQAALDEHYRLYGRRN